MVKILELVYKIWLILRSILCYIFVAVVGILLFIPIIIIVALQSPTKLFKNRFLFWLLAKLYDLVLLGFGLKVRWSGLKHIGLEPVIVIANHESSLDIIALGSLMRGRPHIWYSFKRFSSTPILGVLVRKLGISVGNNHKMGEARSIAKGITLAKKFSVNSIIFPEGGRFIDGEIHDFFGGFAMLSKKLGQPVVPVLLKNFGKAYPPSSFLIYPAKISGLIGNPMEIGEGESEEDFVQRVRGWFLEHK